MAVAVATLDLELILHNHKKESIPSHVFQVSESTQSHPLLLQNMPTTIVGFGVKSVVADEGENCFVFTRDDKSGDVYLNDTACDDQRAVVCELEMAREHFRKNLTSRIMDYLYRVVHLVRYVGWVWLG